MVPAMTAPNLEELRIGGTLRDIPAAQDIPAREDNQAGAPFNAFDRGVRLRHAQQGTWWECVLAVLSLILVTSTLIGVLIRNF